MPRDVASRSLTQTRWAGLEGGLTTTSAVVDRRRGWRLAARLWQRAPRRVWFVPASAKAARCWRHLCADIATTLPVHGRNLARENLRRKHIVARRAKSVRLSIGYGQAQTLHLAPHDSGARQARPGARQIRHALHGGPLAPSDPEGGGRPMTEEPEPDDLDELIAIEHFNRNQQP